MDKKGAGDMKGKAEKIREELISYAKHKDVKGVKEYVTQHRDEIIQIYDQYGGGSDYLLKAYNLVCISDPKFAAEYQRCLETEIAGDVLFSNE
jgi:hypothetical protein